MTLLLAGRTAALRQRLTKLDRSSSDAAEASDLEALRLELDASVAALAAHLEKEALLRSAAIPVALPAALISARKRAKGILEKFLLNGKAATLKRGQGWKALLEETAAASRELDRSITAGWRSYRQTIFAGDPPAAIQSRLAPTEANNDALARYKLLFERLKIAFETLPPDRAAIDRTTRLAEELEEVAKAFDFDVPADVKRFLVAVLSVNGAPLALLTPAVEKWLRENDSYENYCISSTGRA